MVVCAARNGVALSRELSHALRPRRSGGDSTLGIGIGRSVIEHSAGPNATQNVSMQSAYEESVARGLRVWWCAIECTGERAIRGEREEPSRGTYPTSSCSKQHSGTVRSHITTRPRARARESKRSCATRVADSTTSARANDDASRDLQPRKLHRHRQPQRRTLVRRPWRGSAGRRRGRGRGERREKRTARVNETSGKTRKRR